MSIHDPALPWVPTTELDLQTAASNGTLDEGATRLELKQELASGAGSNIELARDLASLAVSGGTLIIGIVDEKHREQSDPRTSLHPIALAGLPERIEQVAATRCEPPLSVSISTIESDADTTSGYVVVQVAESPQAPHMVDGRYWGRTERTKRHLSDADVLVLHQQRDVRDQDASQQLDDYISRDPWTVGSRSQTLAHVYFVAEPRPGRSDMLVAPSRQGQSWERWVRALIDAAANRHSVLGGFAPDFSSASECATRTDGWSASSQLTRDRRLIDNAREEYLIEIEIAEHGAVRVCCGRGSDFRSSAPATPLLFEKLILGLALRGIDLSALIAEQGRYFGQWAFGLGVTGMAGSVSWEQSQSFLSQATIYPGAQYRQSTRSAHTEIREHPERIVDRLIGRLLRSLDVYDHPSLKPLLSGE